jgi:hypothetical protein
MLFYRIKQCQEIQILAQDPYTPTQIINNAVCLLQQSGIFPLKEFDAWDAITPKTYPTLKTFIHEAYTRRLTVMQPPWVSRITLSNDNGRERWKCIFFGSGTKWHKICTT